MSRDYGEKERQFLKALKEDTGRDLNEWMAAIADEKLTNRNDIIDWLRGQGFMFSKASWLERIHNNGGRPLYEGGGAKPRSSRVKSATARAPATPAAEPPKPVSVTAPPATAPRPAAPLARPAPPAPPRQAPSPTLDQLLAKAKAFRPLANFVLGEIAKAVPQLQLAPHDSYVLMSGTRAPFAVLTISARELRLGLALTSPTTEAPFTAAKLPAVPSSIAARFTHMAILTDARQINDALIAKVRETAEALG